jgi:hypothetical protein
MCIEADKAQESVDKDTESEPFPRLVPENSPRAGRRAHPAIPPPRGQQAGTRKTTRQSWSLSEPSDQDSERNGEEDRKMPEEINELQDLVEEESAEEAPELMSGKSTLSIAC